VKQW
jgi:hypothetical protein